MKKQKGEKSCHVSHVTSPSQLLLFPYHCEIFTLIRGETVTDGFTDDTDGSMETLTGFDDFSEGSMACIDGVIDTLVFADIHTEGMGGCTEG